jgi:hypothetical protein
MKMNLLKRQLTLTLTGRLDQDQLNKTRVNLALAASGSAADPVGTELGRSIKENPRYPTIAEVVFTLVRSAADEWTLTVDAIPDNEIPRWRCFAEIGCRAAGLTLTGKTLPPPPKPLTPAEREALHKDAVRSMAALDRSLEQLRRVRDLIPSEPPAQSPEVPSSDAAGVLDGIQPGPPWLTTPACHSISLRELAELAVELGTFIWSWRTTDLLPLTYFGWVPIEKTPDLITLAIRSGVGTRSGVANAQLYCLDDEVLRIEVPVAVTTDADHATELQDIFDQMVTTLTDVIGTPTTRINVPDPQVGWIVEDDYGLGLIFEPPRVQLIFVRLSTWWTTNEESQLTT